MDELDKKTRMIGVSPIFKSYIMSMSKNQSCDPKIEGRETSQETILRLMTPYARKKYEEYRRAYRG